MRSDRLLVLAAHLKSDRRGHKKFDFSCFSQGPRDPERHWCGSAGCALGELPVVWPYAWEFGRSALFFDGVTYAVKLKTQNLVHANTSSAHAGAVEWFELSDAEVHALFHSAYVLPGETPIEALPESATAEQVADRFIAFVKWREEQVAQENQNAS